MRKIRKYTIICFVIVFIGLAGLALQYPGIVEEVFFEITNGSFDDLRNYGSFLVYFGSYLGQLAPDENGIWDFKAALKQAEASSDIFHQALIRHHAGDFHLAKKDFEKSIPLENPSETQLFWQSINYMRMGESENCLAKLTDSKSHVHNGGSVARVCTLPIEMAHTQSFGADRAAEIFNRLLDEYNPKNKLYQWLLNFNYMTLNGFPHDVPQKYLIQTPFIDLFYGKHAEKMKQKYSHLSFTDKALELGMTNFAASKGVAVEDYDNDGYLDIVTAASYGPLKYYRNNKGERFTDQTKEAGLDKIVQAHIITTADYDNDGWADLFISMPYDHFRLFRNQGDGTFSDVTKQVGLDPDPRDPEESFITWCSAWGDFENDGDLDLFVANWGQQVPFFGGITRKKLDDSKLYINENGHFEDRTEAYGLSSIVRDRRIIGAAFGDYDQDGYVDLFLSSFTRGISLLLKNNEGREFVRTNLIDNKEPGFMTTFLDIDHDGDLDLFQGSAGNAKTITREAVFNYPWQDYRNRIYLNDNGRFKERK